MLASGISNGFGSTEIKWVGRLRGWLSATSPLQELEGSSCTNSLGVQRPGIFFLSSAAVFVCMSKQSNFMRLYYLQTMAAMPLAVPP